MATNVSMHNLYSGAVLSQRHCLERQVPVNLICSTWSMECSTTCVLFKPPLSLVLGDCTLSIR